MTRALAWAVPAVALLMLALTITPAEVWDHPVTDAAYSGFDPNLIYVSRASSGLVDVSPSVVRVTAKPQSEPTFILATTPLKRFNASVDVTIQENAGATMPFRIGLWSPWTSAGYFIAFEPAPQNLITAETIVNGNLGSTLLGGNVVNRKVLGSYQLGSTYGVAFVFDKVSGSLTTRVSHAGGADVTDSVDAQQNPKLFNDVPYSLSASASAGNGASQVVLRNYSVNLPHEKLWASKIADSRAQLALITLAIAGLVLIAITLVSWFRSGSFKISRPRSGMRRWTLALVAGAIVAYIAGNAWLFQFGGHPFDMSTEKLYAYVARTYGAVDLYYLPNLVSVPKVWNGIPIREAPFPYEPAAAYLFTGIGWLNSLLIGGGGFSLNNLHLEYLIKSVNVLFGLGDAALIYWILRQIGTSSRWSLVAGGLFLFNPAVWFSQSIWGQTHVISLFLVLLAILLAEKNRPVWAWTALAAACLTRPQILVFGLLLGVAFLRKFTWRQNVSAFSWTVILTFVALVPFTFATGPSLPIDVMANTLHAQEGAPNPLVLNTVSQDTYSVWPLIEYLTQGATGLHQGFNPSHGILVGTLTFARASQIATVVALLLVAGLLFLRRSATREEGGYIPYVALGITAFLMLLFGLISTHFLLALPFLLLARRWMGGVAYFYVAVIWTVTTFVPMYGDMGQIISSQDYPLLAPGNNAVTRFVDSLYTADRFIFVGIVANICALLWLGFLTLRPYQVTVTDVLPKASYAAPLPASRTQAEK